MIKTDFSGIDGFSLSPQFDKAEKACRDVADPGGIYADYNGWVGLPDTISENLLTKITDTAQALTSCGHFGCRRLIFRGQSRNRLPALA